MRRGTRKIVSPKASGDVGNINLVTTETRIIENRESKALEAIVFRDSDPKTGD